MELFNVPSYATPNALNEFIELIEQIIARFCFAKISDAPEFHEGNIPPG